MDEFSKDLIKSVGSSDFTDLAKEYGELGVDTFISQITDNPLIKEVPILKTIIGVSQGVVALRDKSYLKKIFKFLFQIDKCSKETKDKFEQKMFLHSDEVNKAGEAVWEILEQLSSGEKATMIGKVFQDYMNDNINKDELIYMSEIVEKAHILDLQNIERGLPANDVNLENLGIKKPVRTEDITNLIQKSLEEKQERDDQASRASSHGITVSPYKISPMPESQLTDAGYNLVRILTSY